MKMPTESRNLKSEFNIDFDQTLKNVFSELKGETIDDLSQLNRKTIIRQFYKNMNINQKNTRKVLKVEHELKRLLRKSIQSENEEENKLLRILLDSISDIEGQTIAKKNESKKIVSHIEELTGVKELRIIMLVSFILLMIIAKK